MKIKAKIYLCLETSAVALEKSGYESMFVLRMELYPDIIITDDKVEKSTECGYIIVVGELCRIQGYASVIGGKYEILNDKVKRKRG